MTVVVLTATSASVQSWTVPGDCPVGTVVATETWGAGSGASGSSTSFRAGGGGGAWTTQNITVTADHAANGIPYFLNAGGAGVGAASSVIASPTWFGVNILRNSLMQGEVNGTPGTFPTNWSLSAAAGGTISSSSIASGTDANGQPSITLTISGSCTSTSSPMLSIFFDTTTLQVSQSTQYTWSAILSASVLTNINRFVWNIDEFVGTVYNTTVGNNGPALTSTPTRISATSQTTGATITAIQPYIQIFGTSVAAFAITLTISQPQINSGATARAFSPTPGSYALATGGRATVGTTGGPGGSAGSCIPSVGAFAGGAGATEAQGGGGGGSAGKAGAGTAATTGTGGTADNATVAAGVSNVEGGGGATAATSPSAGGSPGGGGGASSSTNNGSAGGRGQIRLTYTPFWFPFKQGYPDVLPDPVQVVAY